MSSLLVTMSPSSRQPKAFADTLTCEIIVEPDCRDSIRSRDARASIVTIPKRDLGKQNTPPRKRHYDCASLRSSRITIYPSNTFPPRGALAQRFSRDILSRMSEPRVIHVRPFCKRFWKVF